MFRTTTGQPINSHMVRLLIGDLLTRPLGILHDVKSLLNTLEEHGYLRSRLKGQRTVWEQIQQLNHLYLTEVEALLINREEIVREESAAAATSPPRTGQVSRD